jgi:hypothetical protein
MSDIYFDGDPATDSARRHLERVLKEDSPRRRRWPWILTAIAGAGVWYFWPRSPREPRKAQAAAKREER